MCRGSGPGESRPVSACSGHTRGRSRYSTNSPPPHPPHPSQRRTMVEPECVRTPMRTGTTETVAGSLGEGTLRPGVERGRGLRERVRDWGHFEWNVPRPETCKGTVSPPTLFQVRWRRPGVYWSLKERSLRVGNHPGIGFPDPGSTLPVSRPPPGSWMKPDRRHGDLNPRTDPVSSNYSRYLSSFLVETSSRLDPVSPGGVIHSFGMSEIC